MSESLDVLRTSLAERLASLGVEDPPPQLLDLELRRVDLPDGAAAVAAVKPRDWAALREATSERDGDPPYWAAAWPSGLALAAHLAGRDDLAGRRVLELGCGLGIAATVAARAGAQVLATDEDPAAVAFAAHTLALNDVEGEVALGTWEALAEAYRHEPFDVVIAADVLYRHENATTLAKVLPLLLAPGGEALVADPGRSGADELWPLLRRRWRRDPRQIAGDPVVTLHVLHRRARGGGPDGVSPRPAAR